MMQKKKIRVGFFSLAHPHVYALAKAICNDRDNFEIVGFAEATETNMEPLASERRRRHLVEELHLKEYEDWRLLLEESLDLGIVNSDNASCEAICCELLKRGIHTLDEKPIAANYPSALRMCRLAKENKIHMLTNWPVAWIAPFLKAKELVEAGTIGKLMRVIYRSPATWGPFGDRLNPSQKETWWLKAERGGGAILDYACYGAMLAVYFFGKGAKRVSAISKQFATAEFSDVEDYSAMIFDFGDGVGLLEGSWATYNPGEIPTGPVLYGERGVIVCDRYSSQVKIYKQDSHQPIAPDEVIAVDCSKGQDFLLGEHLARILQNGEPPFEMLSEDLNLTVQAMLDGGRLSAQTGKTVDIVYESID